jgi:type III secretion protein U
MADKNDSGDKTEKPTRKRLMDARKKGDIPKSKEVTSTMTLLVWLALGALALPIASERISNLLLKVIENMGQPFSFTAPTLGWLAFESALWITGMLLLPVILVGLLTEFLQAGPIFTTEKIKPKLENMNPVAGIKKMFAITNLVEVFKATAKTAVMLIVGWMALKSLMPQILLLSSAEPGMMGTAMWKITLKLLSWTVAAFAAVSVLDVMWQRHTFTKKMRMSIEDIKKEMKQSEGDPHVKGQRRQLQREWAQRTAANTAANANVLVVNPTHVAIAIDYHPQDCPVPVIAAKGEDDTAMAMREAAQEAGVPIVRNIALARDMLARAEVDEIVREDIETHKDPLHQPERDPDEAPSSAKRREAPGEDLTRYPDDFNHYH